jgi:hypothetical protein
VRLYVLDAGTHDVEVFDVAEGGSLTTQASLIHHRSRHGIRPRRALN